MKIKELIEELKKFDPEAKFLVSSDEELNVLYEGFEVAQLGEDITIKQVVIYGLTGREMEQEPF